MEKSSQKLILLLTPLILAFVFFYPRILIDVLGKDSPWTSYLYQYTFGAIFFSIGCLVAWKAGAFIPGRGRDSLWMKLLIGGFLLLTSIHGLWIALALYIPFKGSN